MRWKCQEDGEDWKKVQGHREVSECKRPISLGGTTVIISGGDFGLAASPPSNKVVPFGPLLLNDPISP